MTPLTGGCACSAIRYACDAPPVLSLNCHCRDCQRHSGSAYASILIVPAQALRILRGEVTYYSVVGDSGHCVQRGFCARCGSSVLGKVLEEPDRMVIQAASLDDPGRHRPSADIFVARAQPWDLIDPSRPRSAMSPTPVQVASWQGSEGSAKS